MLRRPMIALTAALVTTLTAQGYAAAATPFEPQVVTDKAVRSFAADAGRVLYQEVESQDLFLRDLSSGQTTKVADDAQGPYLALEGSKAAYVVRDAATKQVTLDLQDVTTKQTTAVVTAPSTFIDIALEQGKLFWGQPDGSQWVFFVQEVGTGARREVTRIANTDLSGSPVLFDGRYMAWTETTNSSFPESMRSSLIALDTTTGKQQVKSRAGAMGLAGIANGTVLYDSFKPSRTGDTTPDTLYLWDAAANTEKWLAARTRTGHDGYVPAISETHAAWSDSEGTHLFALNSREYEKLDVPGCFMAFGGGWLVYRMPDDNGSGSPVRAVAVNPADRQAPPTKPVFYTVRPGDTLWKLSVRFKASVADIVRSNNLLNPDVVGAGDVLYLPYPVSPRFEEVVVQPGDTLGKIAARFKTTVRSIALSNQLDRADVVNVGTVLKVGRGPEVMSDGTHPFQTYAVQPGDTLWNVSARSGLSVQQLMANNQWTRPVELTVGQMMIIRK